VPCFFDSQCICCGSVQFNELRLVWHFVKCAPLCFFLKSEDHDYLFLSRDIHLRAYTSSFFLYKPRPIDINNNSIRYNAFTYILLK